MIKVEAINFDMELIFYQTNFFRTVNCIVWIGTFAEASRLSKP